ncbi:MAG: extracellular solute-binding protein, partial [Pseudomonadota bacterium]
FTLRKNAVWDDGTPITGNDVVWSLQTLKTKAAPFYRAYYADVKDVTTKGAQVTFTFATATNKELPLIIAQMPILPKHYWDKKDFSATTLTPPLSGGPYKIGTIHAGQSIEYVRNPKWWGKDLNVNVGRHNFDTVNFTYYRDQNVALESFFAGNFDVQQENIAKLWATAYNAPAVLDGRIIKQEIANQSPAGMQAFIYNVRRPVFQDRNVRQALAYAFDFEWENKQFAFGTYQRTRSYFENSELSAKNIPTGRELELLTPYRGKIPDDVFTTEYHPPNTDGSGNNRLNLKAANDILDRTGYKVGKDGVRVSDTGTRLSFEMVVDNGAFERWILPFIQNLKKIGVEAHMRVIDDAQYQNRMRKFDYDMTVTTFGQSNSPGNEQREFWTSEKADIEGSRNMIGIKDPVIDDLVKNVISSGTRAELVANTHALDRVLQWNHFVIPNWFFNKWRLAWWSHLEHPEHLSGMTPAIIDTWWVKQK